MSSRKVIVARSIGIILLSLIIIGFFHVFRVARYTSERARTMSDLKQFGGALHMYEADCNITVLPDEYKQLSPTYIGEDLIHRIRSNLIFLELSKDEIEKDILIKAKDKYGSLYLLYADGHVGLVGPK